MMRERDSPRLYSYRVTYDVGAAPNPFWGICTLVICKLMIRRVAEKGDWVVGTGSKNSPIGDISKHVVYAMKITDKLTLEEYDGFSRAQYPNKIPEWDSSDYRRRIGDCIYYFSAGSPPKLRKGVHTETNREMDLSGKYALLSNHFYYFGDQPIELPNNLQKITPPGQGHQSKANVEYVDDFILWTEEQGFESKKLYDEPQRKKELYSSDFVDKCSKQHLDEAEADEEIGLNCE